MKEQGYSVEKLTPTSTGSEIVWDSEKNQFVLIMKDKNGNVEYYTGTAYTEYNANEYYKLWKIFTSVEDVNGNTTYSAYLAGSDKTGAVAVNGVGFDAGENAGIESVAYTNSSANAKSVVIRTNGLNTAVAVNSEKDEVSHYGDAKEVNILRVKKGTYSEYGNVLGNINIAYGFVSLKDGSSVQNVVVKEMTIENETVTPSNSSDFKVTVSSGATVNMVISNVTEIEIPVDGAKASEVPSVTKSEEYKVYIGKTGYANYYQATKNAKDGDTITLMEDTSGYLDMLLQKNEANTVTLDLNGFCFTTLSYADVYANRNMIVKNGKLVYVGANGAYDDNDSNKLTRPAIKVNENASLTLESVEFTSGSYGISSLGNAASVTIKNSTVLASGMALATNNAESSNIKITIDSSTLKSTSYTYGNATYDDTCALMLNTAGTLAVSNSLIEGGAQGVIVRAGNAVIENSEIKARLGTGCDSSAYATGAWTNGNNIMQGALIIGDWSSVYEINASCSLKNTKITTDNSSWQREIIVLSQDGSNKTTFEFDNACGSLSYYVHNIETSGLTKGVIEVNGKIVRPAESK